jgi:hypothetical protein
VEREMKYNVELEFWRYMDDIEADSEEEAIKNALIRLTNDPNDYFTAEDEIANRILDNFNDYSNATVVEE